MNDRLYAVRPLRGKLTWERATSLVAVVSARCGSGRPVRVTGKPGEDGWWRCFGLGDDGESIATGVAFYVERVADEHDRRTRGG